MRLPSSSSLVFAALAISSSSSTLSALAAPAGDPAQAQSGVSAAHNDFRAARRGSVSLARSQADDEDETRSEGSLRVFCSFFPSRLMYFCRTSR